MPGSRYSLYIGFMEPPRSKAVRRLRAFGVGLCITAPLLVGLALVAIWVMPGESHLTAGGKEYIRQNELIGSFLLIAGRSTIACAIVGLVCGIARIKQAWWCLVGVCVGPIALIFALLDQLGAFQVVGDPVRRGGAEYVLLASHFLQGSDLMIAKRLGGPPWAVLYEALAEAPWEESFGYVPVVRPAGTAKEFGLLCSPDGVLVQVSENGQCYTAYDLTSSKEYTQLHHVGGEKRSNIDALSPFVLLSESGRPHLDDEATLLKGEQFAKIRTDVVRRELQSKNPEVRRLAQAVLDRHLDKPLGP